MLSQKKPFIFALLRQNNIPVNAADEIQNLNPKKGERYQVPAGMPGNAGIPNLQAPGFSAQDGNTVCRWQWHRRLLYLTLLIFRSVCWCPQVPPD